MTSRKLSNRTALVPVLMFAALLLGMEASAQASVFTQHWMRSHAFWKPALDLAVSMVTFFFTVLPLIAAELLFPDTQARRNYLTGFKLWTLSFAFVAAWSHAVAWLIAKLDITPALSLKAMPGSEFSIVGTLEVAAAILGSLFVFDFFYYWFHRLQHRSAFLWRFHSVHHAITSLNSVNCYHHVLEEVLRFPFILLPIALLVKIEAPHMVVLSTFVATWGYFIHSDSRINFGRLSALLGDNAYHRIHHSLDPAHFNRNFTAFFPIWDRVFGTYHPAAGIRVPAVGMSSASPVSGVCDYLLRPFRPARIDQSATNHIH